MRKKLKKYTQKDFAARFKSLDQPGASRLLAGKDKVSFPLAVELAELDPSKDILAWKNSGPADINNLYLSLKRESTLCLV